MLIQLPSGSSDQPGPRNVDDCSSFQAGLRRDLASAPVVSYDVMLGGVAKRAIDLAFAVLTAPLWLPAIGAGAAWAKLRHGGRVFLAEECIGYGGRPFKCFALRMQRPVADVEAEAGANEPVIADRPETQHSKWRRAIERLPQFFNVIVGDMAVVGPRPLTRDQLEPLRTARRYYLSARPGVVGVGPVAAGRDEASQYKTYAMAWAVTADALILWDQLSTLWERGPAQIQPRPAADGEPATAQDTL